MMKITSVEPILLRGSSAYGADGSGTEATDNGDWQLLVCVRTDDGLVGWSDIETLAPAAASIIAGEGMATLGFRTLASLLVGKNPLDVEQLWDTLYLGSAYYGRRGIAMHCISAIDNCLWSIRSQAAGLPLAQLLGGRRRDKVRAYASTLFRSTPEGMREATKGYIESGYTAVKFGWGVFGEDPGLDRELVAAAREVLGPERFLMVDPGWYSTSSPDGGTLRNRRENESLCAWLAEYDVTWVEDFIHPERYDEYASVRAGSPVPIAAGEQLSTVWDFERLIAGGCVDVVQPDLTRCGGISVATQITRMAARANIEVVPHSWLTHLLTGYSLQYIATLPRAPFVEFNVSQSPLTGGIAPASLRLDDDGLVQIPNEIGIGVEVDVDFIAAHRVAPAGV